jgi:hypothetical protein
MLCIIIIIIIKIIFFIYIEGFMNIFILYNGIIRPMSRFEYINFKASLVIKVINFNGIKKMAPSSYACHFPCEFDYLSNFQFTTHLSHLC